MPVPMTGHIVTRRRLGRSAVHHRDQLSSTTTVVACSSASNYYCYSRLSHPRSVGGGVRGLRYQTLCCKTASCHHRVAQQAERPAQSGSSTSAPFWAAVVPHGSSTSSLVLYTSDACMQPIMQATRRQAQAQPRWPSSANSAWPLSCLSRPLSQQHQHFWQRRSQPLVTANHGRISVLAPYLTFRSCRPTGASRGQRRPELSRPDLPRAPPTLNRARASQPLAFVPG